jgi:hypothetical protein
LGISPTKCSDFKKDSFTKENKQQKKRNEKEKTGLPDVGLRPS